MSEQLFVKRGRRYYPWGNGTSNNYWNDPYDAMKIGEARLITCPEFGLYRHQTILQPDLASFIAAAEIARHAMEAAIKERAKATPRGDGIKNTPEQQALIEKFRTDMAATGALVPSWWVHSSPFDIVDAGIKAVINYQMEISNET